MLFFHFFLLSNALTTNVIEIGTVNLSDNGIFLLDSLIPDTNLWVLFLNQEQRANFNDQTNNIIDCDADGKPDFPNDYSYIVEKTPSNFTIPQSGIYSVFLSSCDIITEDIRWEASIRNSWVEVNINTQPMTIISYCEIAFYTILTIIWMKNWCKHQTQRKAIHYLIFINLVIFLVTAIINAILYNVYQNEVYADSFIASDLLVGIGNTYMIWICFVCILGLSITDDRLSLKEILISIGVCLIYSIPQILIGSSFSNTFSVVLLIVLTVLFITGYIVYFILYTKISRKTISRLNSHLYIIARRGIDPKTTPSYRKIKLLKWVRAIGLLVFLFQAASTLLSAADILDQWPAYLIIRITNAILVSALCYLCRMRNAMDATFYEQSDSDYSEDSIDDSNGALERPGTRWMNGIPLPSVPKEGTLSIKISGQLGLSEGKSPW